NPRARLPEAAAQIGIQAAHPTTGPVARHPATNSPDEHGRTRGQWRADLLLPHPNGSNVRCGGPLPSRLVQAMECAYIPDCLPRDKRRLVRLLASSPLRAQALALD